MLSFIDTLLDRTTMYRLLTYYLLFLLAVAFMFSLTGQLQYQPYAIALSAAYLSAICWIGNALFAHVFDAPANKESSLITALILALIISPAVTPAHAVFLTAAGILAIASKYVLARSKVHVFNPAAIAVALTAWGAGQTASWWVGSAPMLPFIAAGGLLLARKIRRLQMITCFVAIAYLATIVYVLIGHAHIETALHQITFSSALFFLAFVMLVEPATSPDRPRNQRWYAVLVGLLFPPQVHLGALYTTPETALIIGNIFTHFLEPKVKLLPRFVGKKRLAPGIAEFVFEPGTESDRRFSYLPGQYMEWTLPHPDSDSRGIRRYFTLASSPTEPQIRLGVKLYKQGSTYKEALTNIGRNTPIVAARAEGSFVLPENPRCKLVFIAGGIGITPYRSMVKFMLDKGETRDFTLLYSATATDEIIYKDIFEAARDKLGARIVYALTGQKRGRHSGRIDAEMIRREVPDYEERLFYVSGPHAMVRGVHAELRELGVRRSHIKTDFFPGYE